MRPFGSLILAFLLLAGGCSVRPNSLNNGKVVDYTHCGLPADQGRESLKGRWSALSVPLILDRDFYVADDGQAMPALRRAVQSWNAWSGVRGLPAAFSLKNDGSGSVAGRDIPELSDCEQASYSSALPGLVGVWKINGSGFRWNQRPNCTNSDGKILPTGVQGQTDWVIQSGRIVGASVLLNFEEYNAPGRQRIDLESLLLHELGHVLGLLHSCNGSGGDQTSAPACIVGGVLVAPQQYTNAVMFPFLEANQERRQLQQNDYSRVNCLY